MKNICFKSDGTLQTGKKIIDSLVEFGGTQGREFLVLDSEKYPYYYINNYGYIDNSASIPKGYYLVAINEENIDDNKCIIELLKSMGIE